MRARLLSAILLLVTIATATAQTSNDLVVVVSGSKQFHQPGCAMVAQAGSHVKVMKRSDALHKGLTPHDCRITPDPNTVKVFTQPGDNKYHTATCPKLGAKRTGISLEDAGKKLWPCPVCHPPIRPPAAR